MPFMVWNDRLSVGVESLDDDHKQLVNMLNTLYDGIQEGRGREMVAGILDRLTEYTREHFAREEELLIRCEYPETMEHMHEHSNMTEWLVGLRQRLASGTAAGPSLEAVNFLKDWLFDHIRGADARYVPYVVGMAVRR